MTVHLVFGPSQSIDVRFAASPLMDALCAVRDEVPAVTSEADDARPGDPRDRRDPCASVLHTAAAIPRQTVPRRLRPVLHRGPDTFRCTGAEGGATPRRAHPAPRADPPSEEDAWRMHSRLLQADLTYRMQQLASGGLAAALADLAPAVTVQGRSLVVQTRCEPPNALSCSSGLVLMPMSFSAEVLVLESPTAAETVLFYPARGASAEHRLTGEARRSLSRRLDHTPLPLLRDLHALRTLTAGGNLDAWRRTDLVELLTGVACQACGC